MKNLCSYEIKICKHDKIIIKIPIHYAKITGQVLFKNAFLISNKNGPPYRMLIHMMLLQYLQSLMLNMDQTLTSQYAQNNPDSKVHEAYMGLTGPRWAQCWPSELCYQGTCPYGWAMGYLTWVLLGVNWPSYNPSALYNDSICITNSPWMAKSGYRTDDLHMTSWPCMEQENKYKTPRRYRLHQCVMI